MTANNTTRSNRKEGAGPLTTNLLRRRFITAIGSSGAIMLAGCTDDGGGGDGPSVDWRLFGGSPQNTRYLPVAGPTSEPTERWRFDPDGFTPRPPVVAGNYVYTADGEHSDNRRIYAINTEEGSEEWSEQQYRALETPGIGDGTVVVGMQDTEKNDVLAFEVATGENQWQTTLPPDDGGDPYVAGPPTVTDGMAYVLGDERLYALDLADGEIQWHETFDARRPVMPCVAGDLVVVGSSGEGAVAAYHREDGTEAWRYGIRGDFWGPAFADGLVYVVDTRRMMVESSEFVGLDPDDGSEAFLTSEPFEKDVAADPAIADDTAYVLTRDSLIAVDLDDGSSRWHVSPAGEPTTPPCATDDAVYLGWKAEEEPTSLTAVSTAGEELWSLSIQEDRRASIQPPAIGDGVLYIALKGSGSVVALEEA